eukprot:gnl/TRDRNA2_/TRDRNA2_196881_c0_seq1.p1 gnl/TRDRNA2_/TRDRNA2_196881_c0~~gnl/TRDRNA2_/TRDRNA2_196881_c0_seq1.p1  ORF type:complete len:285 (+),score=51.04 gnl/TRDRNA2_/TRDRNA2_196881_c0_seq1:45-857(+)
MLAFDGQGQTSDTQVMQMCVKDERMPAEIRLGFVKKVYGILIAMLMVSFTVVAPFVFDTSNTMKFMHENPWIYALSMFLLLVQQMVNIAMAFEACCGGGPCQRTYMHVMKTSPWNYMFLLTYSLSFGVVLGNICTQYKASSVGLCLFLTAGIMLALTIYAVQTKQNFQGFGMYFAAVGAGMCMLVLVSMIVPYSPMIHKLIAVCGAVLFSFIIIYDTQLIFGTAAFQLNRSSIRNVEFTVDMYAFAAYQLYLDFVNMFLYILELVGQRRD